MTADGDGPEAGTPYHAGERAVQRRAGETARAERIGRTIAAGLGDIAAAFLGLQPMLVIAAADGDGRLWSSLLTGPPGFLRATGPHTLSVAARPAGDDPLAAFLAAGPAPLGTLALDPRTRRRLRLNGTARATARGLAIDTGQVFANCPKHLQQRTLRAVAPAEEGGDRTVRGAALTDAQRRTVEAADTFFLATADPAGAADAGHRGGRPGFVRATSPTRLSWPDYPGNAMFATLGNLALRPDAGLLFVDWTTGDLLRLGGRARVDWSAGRAALFPGARRVVDFDVETVLATRGGSPLRWSEPVPSPANPPVPPGC
ncbi:pyridoxamine 5'-phosphate oxidase family protein [Streptomyces celluloflavus]|uniref:pyridoxamine 5'-phosphate oxidase family protein n=1 Tax=Streptomyces celluloflavus TaxID=58344 RepID=UPI00378E8BA1